MNAEAASYMPAGTSENPNKRLRTDTSSAQKPRSGSQNSPTNKSPLQVAKDFGAKHVVTLHKELHKPLTLVVEKILLLHSTYFHKNENYQKKSQDESHMPTSVKKVTFTLQPRKKVRDSESFRAAQAQADEVLDEAQIKLKSIALRVDDMNRLDI